MTTMKTLIEVDVPEGFTPCAETFAVTMSTSGMFGDEAESLKWRILPSGQNIEEDIAVGVPPVWLWNLMREFISGFMILKIPPYYEAASLIMDELDKYAALLATPPTSAAVQDKDDQSVIIKDILTQARLYAATCNSSDADADDEARRELDFLRTMVERAINGTPTAKEPK